MKKILIVAALIWLAASVKLNAQLSLEATTPGINYYTLCGWLSFEKNGDTWETRAYTLDSIKFVIMQEGYQMSPAYTYNFTAAERFGGLLLYSLEQDLTGDGITEFYVTGMYEGGQYDRQSVKIFDIVTGNVIIERNTQNFYFSTPTVLDSDNDGVLECVILKYDYPSFMNHYYEVYNTGISTTGMKKDPFMTNFELKQNYPNPFNPSTTINFSVSTPGMVNIDVFDSKGERINTISNNYYEAGSHSVSWDGRNTAGVKVSSGIYFYQMRADNNISTRKMILVK